jgi:hypothetical protein
MINSVSYGRKPKVYIEPYLGCMKCNPWPFSERRWCVNFPYGNFSTMGCATILHPYTYDTWEEAMKAANSYRPPTMINATSGTITLADIPWINNYKWG